MKIMFYINTLERGGAERVMSQLANSFSKAGHQVQLITSFSIENEYPLEASVERYNLEEQEMKQSRIMRNISRICKLRKLCKMQKPDVLVSFMQEPNFRAVLAGFGLSVKTVVSVRNDPNREYAGTIGRFVGRHILPLASGCVFQTEQAKTWFPNKLQKKSAIIMNEVSDKFFNVIRETPEHVVTFGRLTSQKNHELLVGAFAKLADKYPEKNLLIYGQGEKEETLQTMIRKLGMEERIYLMGPTSDVPDALSKAALFVLSSDYEGMPNALMEALAAGVPCVSTDCPCGGPDMLIRSGENGLLVPVGDEKKLMDAMDKLLSDPIMAEQMGQRARESANVYRPEDIFHQWEIYITGFCKKEHENNEKEV